MVHRPNFLPRCWLPLLVISLIVSARDVRAQASSTQPAPPTVAAESPDQPSQIQQPADLGNFAVADATVGNANPFACEPQHCAWPKWYVSAESLFLWRDNHYSWTTASDFDVGVGPRVAFGLRPNADWELEAVYFGVFGMDATRQRSGFFSLPSFSLSYISWEDYREDNLNEYYSELHNAELNLFRTWDRFSLLAGFRFLQLREDFSNTWHSQKVDSTDFSVDRQRATTTNDLFGGQIGARWRDEYYALFWEATGKAGVYGNQSNTGYSDSSAASRWGSSAYTAPNVLCQDVAFVGDLNFSAGLRFSKTWAVRGGYNLLWIDNVAMAADPLQYPRIPILNSHDVFLHGANVGVEGTW